MGGPFLQTSAASVLKELSITMDISSIDRDMVTAFLTQGQGSASGYAPASGQIVGILKQMTDTMESDLAEITATEEKSIKDFSGLMAAKTKEINALTKEIETKIAQVGELGVQLVTEKEDLDDTSKQLMEDAKFLKDLEKNCKTKEEEWATRCKIRAEEVLAIADTIKILNDDDALELFKKTLPSPSLLQLANTNQALKAQALAALKKMQDPSGSPDLSLISMALRGKKVGFEKVLKMIDELVGQLAKEQEDDDAQLKWCSAEFDTSEDTEKDLKRRISGLETKISEAETGIATLIDELAVLKKGIKDTDKAVEEATTQRKDEHKEFVASAAENNAALQLLEVAKNRLNKFYNPNLYVAPTQRPLTAEEKIYVNSGGADPRIAEAEAAGPPGGIAGTGVTVFAQTRMRARDAPPPPPETVDAYAKKDASGPVALIDKLKRDLEMEVAAAERDEAEAQKDYEEFMSDSVAKRTADSKSITEKEAQKAGL